MSSTVVLPYTFAAGRAKSSEVNANFSELATKFNTYGVRTDVAAALLSPVITGNLLLTQNAMYLQGRTSGGTLVNLFRLTADANNITRFIAGVDAGGFQWTDQAQAVSWGTLAATTLALPGAITMGTGLFQTNPSPATGVVVTSSVGTTTAVVNHQMANTGNTTYFGLEGSAGGVLVGGAAAYATVLGTSGARSLHFFTNNVIRGTISSTGAWTIDAGATPGVTINAATGGMLKLVSTNNTTADQCYIQFTRGSTAKWLVGTNLDGASNDNFVIRPNGGAAIELLIDPVAHTVTLPGLGGASGLLSIGAADSGGVGFKLVRVPN